MRLTSCRFQVNGRAYQAKVATYQPSYGERRPYPSNASLSLEMIERPGFGDSEEEWAAWSKASLALARPVVSAALALFDVESDFTWSATRLCSCRCSPAFILSTPSHPLYGPSFHVDIEEAK